MEVSAGSWVSATLTGFSISARAPIGSPAAIRNAAEAASFQEAGRFKVVTDKSPCLYQLSGGPGRAGIRPMHRVHRGNWMSARKARRVSGSRLEAVKAAREGA